MKTYSRLLLASCVADLGQSVVLFFVQPVAAMEGGMSFLYIDGFTKSLPVSVNLTLLASMCFFINAIFACTEVQFFCRYLMMCSACDVNRLLKWLLAPISFSLLVFSVGFAWTMRIPPEDLPTTVALLQRVGWNLSERDYSYLFGCSLSDFRVVVLGVVMAVHCSFGAALIMWCEYKVYSFVKTSTNAIQLRNADTHKDVHRALVAMATTPLALLAVPAIVFVVLTSMGVSSSLFVNILMDFAGLGLLINPIVTVVCIRPYRRTVVSMVRKKFGPALTSRERSDSVYYARRNTLKALF